MNWHALETTEIFREFSVKKESGLTQQDAEERLEKDGPNTLPKGNQKTIFNFLFEQFKSPLVYILILAAGLTSALAVFVHGDEPGLSKWVDTIAILLAVLVNVSVGFFQEFRANNILEKLTQAVSTKTLVLRDGDVHEVDAKNIVTGDVLLLKPGTKVPADVRIFEAAHLHINEAALTGESAPVVKKTQTLDEDTPLANRTNMAFMGTIVTRGEGRAVVVNTAGETEFGKIAALTQDAEEEKTPLQKRIGHLGKIAAILIAITSVVILVFGLLAGRSFEEMLTTTIAIFVAAVPEGLPAALSIVLAVAAQKILRHKGVVKRLVSAETLGSCSVICTDKTGTLTEGHMRVKHTIAGDKEDLAREIMALSNEAFLEKDENGDTSIRGETTDKAKMQAFLDEGGDLDALLEERPRESLLGFRSSRNYIASLHRYREKSGGALYVSGSPERVLASSQKYFDHGEKKGLSNEERSSLKEAYEDFAGQGFRMIGLAVRELSEEQMEGQTDLEEDAVRERLVDELTFVGFVAIGDPVRRDVPESITQAREAGIKIVMMTGDHMLTAKAIGKELGFDTKEEDCLEGADVETLSDEELSEKLHEVEIFARVNPEHKMRIIRALQSQGEVVAMTGDGINDAPALKTASIGVAVDSGTDIAKEASDLVLLDDSFTTIVEAVKRGRVAFSNIKKVCIFLFSASFTEFVLILLTVFLKLPLPLTAVMILWTNLVGDSLPNIALAFEPGEKGIMKEKPKSGQRSIFDKEGITIVVAVVLVSSVVLFALFLALFYQTDMGITQIQTIIFGALGLGTFFYVYSIKSLSRPIWSYNIFSNRVLVLSTFLGFLAMAAAVYMPFLNFLLGTVPLGWSDWAIVVATSLINVIAVEIVKQIFFRKENKRKDAEASMEKT